jgi:hypothetical protein
MRRALALAHAKIPARTKRPAALLSSRVLHQSAYPTPSIRAALAGDKHGQDFLPKTAFQNGNRAIA